MPITSYDFSQPSNFTLSNITISSLIASLQLLPQTNQIFSQTFSSSAGFTFNAGSTAIGSGSLSQISQLITPTFTNLVNASTGPGTVTKTAGGAAWNAGATSTQTLTGTGFVQTTAGASTTNQMMGLSTSDPGGNYAGINFAIYFSTGTTRVYELGSAQGIAGTYSPGDVFQVKVTGTTVTYLKNGTSFYTSAVVATFPLFFACAILAVNDVVNAVQLQNGIAQYLADTIVFPAVAYPGTGALQAFTAFSAIDTNSPGYILNGLYWNGSVWVSSNTTYGQSNTSALVAAHITTLPAANSLTITVLTQTGSAQSTISNPLTATYTGQRYTSGSITTNSSFTSNQLTAFAATFSASGSDIVRFGFLVNSILMYWNGSAWSASDGSAGQLNTLAQIQTNLFTLLTSTMGYNVQIFILLTSASTTTTPTITNFSVTYLFHAIEPPPPAICTVFGYLYDLSGNGISGASVTFTLLPAIPGGYSTEGSNVIGPSGIVATTDSTGYFQTQIVQSLQFNAPAPTVSVVVTYRNAVVGSSIIAKNSSAQPIVLQIPSAATVNITSLLN